MKAIAHLIFALLIASSQASAMVFAKANAGGANNGASWADAYTNLQEAPALFAPIPDIGACELAHPRAGFEIYLEFDARDLEFFR